MNIYSSSILVEVEGVSARAALVQSDAGKAAGPNGRRKSTRGVKANRPRSTHPRKHDPGGRHGLYSSDDVLPTAEDLAHSFVDTEPPSEKAKLKATLAKSQDLGEDQIRDHEDEGSEEGQGVPLSLPGFVADFLKGVQNRLKVEVRGIQVEVTLKLDMTSANPLEYGSALESPTLRLAIGSVSINAVSQYWGSAETPALIGERRIAVRDVQGMIISDASFFAIISQYSGPTSPAATLSSTFPKRTSRTSPLKSSSTNSSDCLATMQSTVFESVEAGLPPSEPSGSIVTPRNLHLKTNAREWLQDSKRFSNSASYEDFDNGLLSKQVEPKTPLHLEEEDEEDSEGLTMSDFLEQEPPDQATDSYQPMLEGLTSEHDSVSVTTQRTGLGVKRHEDLQTYQYESRRDSRSKSRLSSESSFHSRTQNSSSTQLEDLTQSKMFSHDEAESMYMSATSHADPASQHGLVRDSSIGMTPAEETLPSEGQETLFHSFQGPMTRQSPLKDLKQVSQRSSTSNSLNSSPASTHEGRNDHRASIIDNAATGGTARRSSNGEQSPSRQRSSSASSKSASCIVKHFLRVDYLDVTLPQVGVPDQPMAQASSQAQPGQESIANPSVPGAFSVRASFNSKHESPDSVKWDVPKTEPFRPRMEPMLINVQNITLITDMSFLRLMIIVVQQVPDMLSSSAQAGRVPGDTPSSSSTTQSHNVEVDSFSIKFVDVLKGYLESNVRLSSSPLLAPDVLLEIVAHKISSSQEKAGYSSRLEASIGQFTLGYPDEPIISFSSAYRIRESIRDSLSQSDKDVRLKLSRTFHSPLEINIEALPLHVSIDLARLDDTFAWFGGLSTVLGLGNSMMSTVTVTDQKSRIPNASKAQKGVRFATPGQSMPDSGGEPLTQAKVNTRIGGFRFDLLGKESSLRVEGTAIRIVNRPALVGLGIDRLRFRGPVLRTDSTASPIDAQIGPIRLEYTQVPKEPDLERLLSLLSLPQDGTVQDPDILVDTLLRQRRNGGLLRINIEDVKGKISPLQDLERFQMLSEELKKLSTVAKYLPEDDRPGILVLAMVRRLELEIDVRSDLGSVTIDSKNLQGGLVTMPSLFLLSVDSIGVEHQNKQIVAEVVESAHSSVPMIMARWIGDEMEPTLKVKLYNFCFEYHVTTIMAFLGVDETATGDIIADNLANSVATLTSLPRPPKLSSQSSSQSNRSSSSRVVAFDVTMNDSGIGLNPRGSQGKGLVVLTDARLRGTFTPGKDSDMSLSIAIHRSSLMIIDDEASLILPPPPSTRDTLIQTLSTMGFVSISDISSARVEIKLLPSEGGKAIDVEIRDDLFVLETCADSSQTLLAIFSGLSPPVPPSKVKKYKTEETVPVEDMIKSCIEDALVTAQTTDPRMESTFDEDEELTADMMDDDMPQNLQFISSFYNPEPSSGRASVENSMLENSPRSSLTREIGERQLPSNFDERFEVLSEGALNFDDDHFETSIDVGCTAHRWNSVNNTYGRTQESKIKSGPFRLRIRDVHFIWNLFDGYDWQRTRDAITQVVSEVESRAAERLAAKRDKRKSLQDEDEDESVEACLFNSVYVTIPANQDPRDLARQINHHLDDLSSEAESYATTTTLSASPSRQAFPKTKRRRLRLHRSKHHKMTFELKGVSADVIAFPPNSGETQSSVDVRVHDLEIFDHVPTSTWKKFATYMRDAGERESKTNMVHIEILNIKPVPELAASELSLKVTVLPLRLHVDQDALDFLTRFFEFKDETATKKPSASEGPFLSRVEISPIPVKLDFKPKRVDYAGLRSGHTTEFMNFFILDGAEMVLRRTILYGVVGFDKLGKSLNDIWMPDVKRNQLPTVLAGLAPVRSLVNVGSGVRDLVIVPIREYRKDGRIVRAMQKGAVAFAKTTTTELAKLGAKLAIGTQNVLQSAEGILAPSDEDVDSGGNEDESPADERRTISPYADQPINVVQGLRGAYRHLGRDLLLAKDAIVAMPGEVRESGSATGAAKVVLRGAPTVVLRPALGVSKAVGQTLLGAANSMDEKERRRVEDVSLPFLFDPSTLQ